MIPWRGAGQRRPPSLLYEIRAVPARCLSAALGFSTDSNNGTAEADRSDSSCRS